MEPSTFVIDQEIKFKKVELTALAEYEGSHSPWYSVCDLSHLKYCISLKPKEKDKRKREKSLIILFVTVERAARVDADLEVTIQSSSFFARIKQDFKGLKYFRKWICNTSELFDASNNCFTNGEMTLKIKGIFKIDYCRIKYPFSLQWKVKERDLKALKKTSTKTLRTQSFKVSHDCDIRYFIVFFPNGSCENTRGETRVGLYLMLRSYSKIDAVWKISADSFNYASEMEHTFEDSRGWGCCLCTTEELYNPENGYFVHGELTLNVSGIVMIEKEREPTILALKNGIVQKGYHRGKNFTIIVGERLIKVHKHVLQSASPVFAGMFGSNLKEVKEKEMAIIDFEYEIVHAAIKLLYSTSVPQTFTYEQMIDLLQFSDKYEINLIKDAVQDYLIERISPTNVCSLINATTTFINAPKLLSKCKEYLIDCLKTNEAVHGLDTLAKDVMQKILILAVSKSV